MAVFSTKLPLQSINNIPQGLRELATEIFVNLIAHDAK
jgi:hypothetical protein